MFEPSSGLMGRLRRAATARPTWWQNVQFDLFRKCCFDEPFVGVLFTCGKVEVEILVSPSSKKVTVRLAKSMPLPAGIDRIHSYQKPVDTAM